MNNKKIIFMGTPNIAAQHLEVLIKEDLNIIGVFTQPPRKKNRGMQIERSAVHKIALKNNLEIFHPSNIDKKIINKIKSLDPDLIIVVAYGQILPEQLLNIPQFGCINIHLSLLPRWRGAAPIEHALLAGDKSTGISIIKISPELDAGDIILQESILIADDTYSDYLTISLTNLGKKLMMKVLPNIFENKINLEKQNKNKVTYASKFSNENRKINFNNSAEKVFNHIRAHGPKPGSWFMFKGERIKILKAIKSNIKGEKSTILNKDFLLACDDGSIIPIYIQREGKKAVSLQEFLRGFSFSIYEKLNA